MREIPHVCYSNVLIVDGSVSTVISITAHAGMIRGFESVLGREQYALPTGGTYLSRSIFAPRMIQYRIVCRCSSYSHQEDPKVVRDVP